MIGHCPSCNDPAADLKVNKSTRKVFCTNQNCGAENKSITEFMINTMLSNKEYLETSSNKANTLPCSGCNGDTPTKLGRVEMETKEQWANAENEDRYIAKCTICDSKKSVSSFMLNALIETEK